jgi:hypothetical protein
MDKINLNNVLNNFFQGSSYLKVSTLKLWMDKAYTKTYFIKGFDSLNHVFMKIVFKNNEKPNSQTVEQETPPQTLNREESNLSELMFKQLLEHDDTDNYDYNEELVVMNQKKILNEEITVFSSLLKERK